MATYFHSSNNEREAAPMLYLRETWPSSSSESPVIPGNMMMYMNYSSSSGSCTDALAGNSQQQQNNSCNKIPTVGASVSTPSPQQEILSNLGGSRIGEQDFSGWGNGRNEVPFMHLMGGASDIQGLQNLQGQGLSLSLSPQIPAALQLSSIDYRNPNSCFSSFLSPNLSISGEESGRSAAFRDDENSQSEQMRNADYMQPGFLGGNADSMKMDLSPYGMSSFTRTIPNSKYLRAAQQLLDEVVSVQKALKQKDSRKDLTKSSKEPDGGLEKETTLLSGIATSSNPQEPINNSLTELSAAERQDLQNKLTKLLSMLDEVDRRYKQYYHQMHIVVSSFDVIAGSGAAKPYTSLALQTISRHFRCLRDAIAGQIQATRRGLGEQDAPANGNGVGISRLRYVDQHLRQQKALQQLGMMQQHPWRPQRGLPESSVSILRAWLFEHFLHPYPKDADKIMLARQTGLSRSQVSNWFINARVRLWKPMVEEMYKEETGDAEMDSNSSSEIAPKAAKGGDLCASEDKGEDLQQTATSTAIEHSSTGRFNDSKHDRIPDVEMAGTATNDGLFPDTIVQSNGGGNDRFMTSAGTSYRFSELGRFGNGSGGGVSLTLGLQHCEGGGGGLPMSVETHRSFVALRGGDEVYNNTESSSAGRQAADFGSSSHLLHDFVA